MTNSDIDEALRGLGVLNSVTKETSGESVRWRFWIQGVPAFIQTQASFNRMRIVAEIGNPKHREHADLTSLMRANYHSALDARYAVCDNRLVAAFIHPLKELTREQFVSALWQVVNCTHSCGRENSGGNLVFGSPSVSAVSSGPSSTNMAEHIASDKQKESPDDSEVKKYRRPLEWREVIMPIVTAIIGALGVILAGLIGS